MSERVKIDHPPVRMFPNFSVKPIEPENLNLYQISSSIKVPCIPISQLDDEIILPPGAPFSDDLTSLEVVEVNTEHHNDAETGRLIKTSPIHGRSYEVVFGRTQRILWQDEYGNLFTALNTKGNNLTQPSVRLNGNSPSGYLIYGLQDSYATLRILKASRLLRREEIDTEVVVGLLEPTALPVEGKMITVEEYKQYLLRTVWEEDAAEDPESSSHRIPRSQLPELAKALFEARFFVSVRGLQINERLEDLERVLGHEDQMRSLFKTAFDFVNKNEELKAKRDKGYKPARFDAESDEDIKSYLTEYLPKRVATNLARMHNLGLVHWFPHIGNISMVGSFYDLDTIRGEALEMGDEPVTEEIKRRDVRFFFKGDSGGFGADKLLFGLTWNKIIDMEDSESFFRNFYQAYATERGWMKNPAEYAGEIFLLFEGFSDPSVRESLDNLMQITFGEDLRQLKSPEEINAESIREAITEVTHHNLDDEIERLGIFTWKEIIKLLINEGILEQRFAQKSLRLTITALFDLFANNQTLELVERKFPSLSTINQLILQKMLTRWMAFKMFDEVDQDDYDKEFRAAAISYGEKADIDNYEDDLIAPFVNGVLEERSELPRLMVRDGKSIYVFEKVGLEQVLGKVPPEQEVILTVHRVSENNLKDIDDREATGPRYLFTDGETCMVRFLPIVGMASKNASFYLWVGDRAPSEDGKLSLHIQTATPLRELKKMQEKYPNLTVRARKRKNTVQKEMDEVVGKLMGIRVILED